MVEPTSRSSTSSSLRRPAEAINSCARSCASSRGRGLAVEANRISGGTPACLFNSFNFDFDRLRTIRTRRLPHGAPRRRPDRRVSRLRRRHGRGGSPRSTQSSPTRPCSSRATASRSTSSSGSSCATPVVIRNAVDPAIFHPPDATDVGRRPAASRDRVELVGEPAQGRGHACLARPRARPVVRELTFVGTDDAVVRAGSPGRPGRLPRRRAPSARARRLPRGEPGRPVLERAPRGARVRASRRRTSTAAVIRSSSAKAACRSGTRRTFPMRSTASSPSSTASARTSAFPRIAAVADSYLDVLGLAQSRS